MRTPERIGMWAGWAALTGIFGYHLGLQAIVGQRVSGTLDGGAIEAYYAHDLVALASIEQFLVIIPMLVFAVALRTVLDRAESEMPRFAATIGLVALIAEIPVLLVVIATQAALVAAVQAGEDVIGLFRFWDVLYNSGAYALEATWVAAFGLAMRSATAFPRPMPALSLLLAGLMLVNVSAIWIGLPDQATLPANILLGVWFAGASIGLGRMAARSTRSAGTAEAAWAGQG